MNDNVKNIINTIKLLGVDMISNAKSGHPGIVLGAAPIMYTLFANHLNINPQNPNWFNRDRFILSAGHGSALLYATLYAAGYDIDLEDIAYFRSINSKTPGHPEYGITPGVDVTTGPLGQGLATAVGIAMGERYLANLVSKEIKNQKLIDYYTYVLCGDGDLMEGISYEAASIAGLYRLRKLIVLYDSNDVTLDGKKSKSVKEDLLKRFDACNWHVEYVKDGDDVLAINKAITRAKRVTNKPSIIEIKTIIGKGSFNQGTNIVHGSPLSKDDLDNLRRMMKIDTKRLEVIEEDIDNFRKIINDRVSKKYKLWYEYYSEVKKTESSEIQRLITFFDNGDISLNFRSDNFKIADNYVEELRESNSKIMNIIASRTPFILGGSADLGSSCKTNLVKEDDFSRNNYGGRNIYYGVREHAMAAITNGLSLLNLRAYCSTFLSFSNYQLPSIRLAALMKVPAIYIFTHDSIAVGEDGPTHQPIEQLLMLRSIPNLVVYRPADINEVIGSWENILNNNDPVALVISKNELPIIKGSDATKVKFGGYIIGEEKPCDGVIIATGSEVNLAAKVIDDLKVRGKNVRLVSMVSIELFKKQNLEYQKSVIPDNVKVVVIEAGSHYSWGDFTTEDKMICLDRFGLSGHKDQVLDYFGFTEAKILEKCLKIF